MRTRKIIPRFRKSKRKFGGTKHLRNQRGGFISWLRRFLETLFERLFGSWTRQETKDAAEQVIPTRQETRYAVELLSTALESGNSTNVSDAVSQINQQFQLDPERQRTLNQAVDVLSAALDHETVDRNTRQQEVLLQKEEMNINNKPNSSSLEFPEENVTYYANDVKKIEVQPDKLMLIIKKKKKEEKQISDKIKNLTSKNKKQKKQNSRYSNYNLYKDYLQNNKQEITLDIIDLTKAVIAEEKKNLQKLKNEYSNFKTKISQQRRKQKIPTRGINEKEIELNMKTKIKNLELKIQELENT